MKTGKTRKVHTNKSAYMNAEAFADLKEAMEDAAAFERGKRRDLRVTQIQAPRSRSRSLDVSYNREEPPRSSS